MDAAGSNIRVDVRGREVQRVMPRLQEDVNEEWISDKSRFIWDGRRRQRLDVPYIREGGKLRKAGWSEALAAAARAMQGRKVLGLVGDLAPVEAAFSLKQLIEGLGGAVECRTDGARLPMGNRSAYVGTAAISDIDTASAIILIGTNPRDEAAVLNARLRKAWGNGAKITVVGPEVDLTYEYTWAGADRAALADMLAQAEPTEGALVILGQGAINEADGEAVLAHAMALAEKLGGKYLVLHTAAGRVGAMDVGAVTEGGLAAAVQGVEVIYNLGADEIDIKPASEGGPLVIYQGSHGDRGAMRADIILPAAAYTEENGLFVNTEGRPQLTFRAGFAPGEAKENWAILRALSAETGAVLPWNDLAGLRRALIAAVPHLARIDTVPENTWAPVALRDMAKASFRNVISDFYFTNPIARASVVMAECSALHKARLAGSSMAAE